MSSGTSLAPVPEDELAPVSSSSASSTDLWRSASTPHLPPPTAVPGGPRRNSTSPRGGRSPSRSPHRHHRPSQQHRPISYPPVKDPLVPDIYYAPSHSTTSERDSWLSPRGSMGLRSSEYFYEPPAPGTVTVASSLSGVDMEEKPVWYRRKGMMIFYLIALLLVIAAVVAIIVVFSK